MSVPKIPTKFTHDINPTSPFDVDSFIDGGLDTRLSGAFNAVHGGTIGTQVSGNLATDNVLKLTGDSNAPVSTDSKIEILNLPRFTLEDIKDFMKVRVRIPNYSNVCFKVLGVELMSVCMGGESQVITEPYVPNAAERCETDCCEPDTRPFPEGKKTKSTSKK
ncbi:hypothetical protein [Lacinutrix chionoecetis]